MRALVLASLLWLGACAKRGPESAADPAELLAEARSRKLPFALRGAFSVTIHRGEAELSTRGGLVLHAPDRFRVEVLGPVGTPALIVASDGGVIDVWNAQDQVFYRGPDADAVLAELSGGAVTLSDVVRVLTATLPLPEAPVRSATVEDRHLALTLDAPEQTTLVARVDGRSGLLEEARVEREGATLLSASYPSARKIGRTELPWEMSLSVPAIQLRVDIQMQSWDELGQVPEVFSLTPPAGAQVKDLVTSLREAAEKAGRPPP